MKNKSLWGRVALCGTSIVWGTSFFILKNTLDSISAMWVLAIRFTAAALLMALAANKKLLKVDRKSIKGAVLMGACLAVAYIVQTYGLVYTTPGKNAFLTSTYCVLVPFLAWLIYKRKPKATSIIAAFVCVAGVGFVSLDSAGGINVGDVLTLCCGVFYALQIIIMEKSAVSCDPMSLSTIQFAVTGALCWVGALIAEPVPTNVPASAWLSILYLSVMCTAVCWFLQAWGMQYTPSAAASVIMTLESVFGTLFSVIFYREHLSFRLVIGFALIFFSVVISETGLKFLKRKKCSSP